MRKLLTASINWLGEAIWLCGLGRAATSLGGDRVSTSSTCQLKACTPERASGLCEPCRIVPEGGNVSKRNERKITWLIFFLINVSIAKSQAFNAKSEGRQGFQKILYFCAFLGRNIAIFALLL